MQGLNHICISFHLLESPFVMKRLVLFSVICIYTHLSAQFVDPCFTSATVGTSFASTTSLGNTTDADLCRWTGSGWTGGFGGANLTIAPRVNLNTCRAIWIGSPTVWTTGGEGFAIRLTTPLVTGVTYTFPVTYVSHGTGSTGSFSPNVRTNSTAAIGGSFILPNMPAVGNTWTTNNLTFTATAAQNGHQWILFGSWTNSSGFINSFCPACNITPLPIELLAFDVKPDGNSVHAVWLTATETNNDHFILERSKDAINFESAGRVDGAGNSNEVLEYSFTDAEYYFGVNYYRLKQVDFDGQYSYSEIRTVVMTENLKVYPNPTSDMLKIPTEIIEGQMLNEQNASIEIRNNTGEVILTSGFSPTLDVTRLPVGYYSLQLLTTNGKIFTSPFIKR